MTRSETTLEMVSRHAREGLKRIAVQEAMILRLEQSDPGNMLPAARLFLVEMISFQKGADEHLACELAEIGRDTLS